MMHTRGRPQHAASFRCPLRSPTDHPPDLDAPGRVTPGRTPGCGPAKPPMALPDRHRNTTWSGRRESAARGRILFLSCHLPWPPVSGGRRRELELIKRLGAQFEIHLVVVSKTSEQDVANAYLLADACREVAVFAAEPAADTATSDHARSDQPSPLGGRNQRGGRDPRPGHGRPRARRGLLLDAARARISGSRRYCWSSRTSSSTSRINERPSGAIPTRDLGCSPGTCALAPRKSNRGGRPRGSRR